MVIRAPYDGRMSAPTTASLLQGAQRALSEGNPRKAADLSRKALRYEPRNSDAVYFLGLAHASSGELAAAIERWRQVMVVNPHQPELRENLARAYYAQAVDDHRAGRLTAALTGYEQALTLIPEFAVAWRDRGRVLESLQRLSDALASYEQAAALAPDDAGSLSGALSISVRTCNWQLAGRSLQQLRQLPDGLNSIHPFPALSVIEDPAELATIAAGRAAQSMVAAGVGRTSFPERRA